MNQRTDIADFEQLLEVTRLAMLDGIIRAQSFADTVSGILTTAAAFGADEADRGKRWPATVDAVDFDDLKRNAVRYSIESLFNGRKFESVANHICLVGGAFGHRSVTSTSKS